MTTEWRLKEVTEQLTRIWSSKVFSILKRLAGGRSWHQVILGENHMCQLRGVCNILSKDFWKESFCKTGDPWHQWETEQSPRGHPDVQLSSIIRDCAGRDRWHVVCVWTSVSVSIWINDNKRRKDYWWIDNNSIFFSIFRLDYLVTYRYLSDAQGQYFFRHL